MAAVPFDTLKLAQRLEAAGFPSRQAQDTAAALAETLTSAVATSADVHETEARLRGEIRESEARLHGEIREMELRLRAEVANLRAELLKWAVGIGVAGVLAVGGM